MIENRRTRLLATTRKARTPLRYPGLMFSIGVGRPLVGLPTDMPVFPMAPTCAWSGVWPLRIYQRLARCVWFPHRRRRFIRSRCLGRRGVYRGNATDGLALSAKPLHTSCVDDGSFPSGLGGWDFPATPAPRIHSISTNDTCQYPGGHQFQTFCIAAPAPAHPEPAEGPHPSAIATPHRDCHATPVSPGPSPLSLDGRGLG